MKISTKQLKYKNPGEEYKEGYRLVYFTDNSYTVGAYSPSIEGFMIGLSKFDPIIDEDDIPPFISTRDMLKRTLLGLTDKKINKVALYKVDGTFIDSFKIY